MTENRSTFKSLTLVGISLFLIITASSCGKYVGDVDANYLGTWYTDTVTVVNTGNEEYHFLILDGEKNSEYGYRCPVNCPECDLCYIITTGNAKINKKRTKLYIGTTNNTTPLSIDEEPIEINGTWRMKIASRYYYRQ